MSNPSKAKLGFDQSIKDAEELLAHYDRAARGKIPAPPDTEVLKRAGLILAITAWETYVEDKAQEVLEDKLRTIVGSSFEPIIRKKFTEEIKRFHNPDSAKTQKLFLDYVGIDPTANWKCWSATSTTKKQLDKWVAMRGTAAHRSKGGAGATKSHLVSRADLEKVISFLRKLVDETEKAI